MRTSLSIALAVFGAVAVSSVAAAADEVTPTPSTEADQPRANELQEVVVTAQKRVENLQSVPLTVSAVSGVELRQQGVHDITDLGRAIPELSVAPVGSSYTNLSIRGVITSYSPTNAGTTAVAIDGDYLARFTGLQGYAFDLQRVEVLDGPQGTLYGRNAVDGVVNFITNKPTQEFGGSLDFEIGNYNLLAIQGALNLPLTDTLSTRIAVYHFGHGGYFTDSGQDDADIRAARVETLWKPTSADSLLLTVDYGVIGGKGNTNNLSGNVTQVVKNPTVCINGTATTLATPAGTCAVGTPTPVTIPVPSDPWHNSVLVGDADYQSQNTTNLGYVGQYDHDFGWATLTAQGSWRRTSTSNHFGTIDGPDVSSLLPATGGLFTNYPSYLKANSKWSSGELRLASNEPLWGMLTWLVGAYRFHETTFDNEGPGVAALGSYSSSALTILKNANGGVIPSFDVNESFGTDSASAVFTQNTFTPSFLPRLHLTFGGRYNWESVKGVAEEIIGGVVNPFQSIGVGSPETASWTGATYKLNLSFDLTSQSMVYIDRSTGFKSGGIGFGSSPVFQPEKLAAWEVGTKNRFFDNKLQVNAAWWYWVYTGEVYFTQDYTYDANNPLGLPPRSFPPTFVPYSDASFTNLNAGRSVSKGVQLSVTFLPTAQDMVNFNGQEVVAKFTDFNLADYYARHNEFNWCSSTPNGATPAGGCPGPVYNLVPGGAQFSNFTGTQISNQGTPQWAFNATYDHIFHILNADWDFQVADRYVGRVSNTSLGPLGTNPNLMVRPAYNTVDLSLRYAPQDAKWAISAWVRNVGDTLGVVQKQFNNGVSPPLGLVNNPNYLSQIPYGFYNESFAPPRTWGLRWEASF